MNYLNSYLRSKLDLSHIGFARGEKKSRYFCTPVLSKVIGWAGVEGIHFCTTKGFDEMIFAVSPMNTPGEYVHPVANNFEDFLRLILACHDTAAIELCWFMDREVFEDFIANNPPMPEMQACLDTIRKKYGLAPMEDPFAYIQDLQKDFNYSQLKFPSEYYELVEETSEPQAPEWKTTWDGDFFDTDPDTVGAGPVKIDTSFRWAGIDWHVPEVYPYEQGVILFLLGKVNPAQVPHHTYEDVISPETHERLMAENPLNLHSRPEASVNGLLLRPAGSMGITWMPQEGWDLESKWVLEHYELDLESAWQINRIKFFWPACGKLNIQKMSLTMRQNPVPVSGTHFKTPLEGESVQLVHPQTGKEYTVFVDELNQETADYRNLHDREMEYPPCYTQMVYRIQPDMDRDQFRIVDCASSDQPRYRKDVKRSEKSFAVSVGIIGGADGPTTIILGQSNSSAGKLHVANSSLHFEPAGEIEWRIVFQEKTNEDMTVSLI